MVLAARCPDVPSLDIGSLGLLPRILESSAVSTVSPHTLFAAIDAGDPDLVASALGTDATLAAARDADGVSATMHALYRGRRDLAETIAAVLPELDVFEAAALGRVDRLVALLLADPALATARSSDGFTALPFPAFFGIGHAAAASRLLIESGADVNARSANSFSVMPLHSAVAGNHDAVVAVLIDAGADVNATQPHGWTPLLGAAKNGSLASVERLLAAGADPAARNDDGASALELARAGGHTAIVARLD
jgi:ankyrin repeat protein